MHLAQKIPQVDETFHFDFFLIISWIWVELLRRITYLASFLYQFLIPPSLVLLQFCGESNLSKFRPTTHRFFDFLNRQQFIVISNVIRKVTLYIFWSEALQFEFTSQKIHVFMMFRQANKYRWVAEFQMRPFNNKWRFYSNNHKVTSNFLHFENANNNYNSFLVKSLAFKRIKSKVCNRNYKSSLKIMEYCI